MLNQPSVSVLLPVGNDKRYLKHAIDSIERQSYKNIELLIGEDQERGGISKILNKLAATAKGKYLARMDADDISEPDRIDKQVKYLETHPQAVVVGSWATLIGESGKKIGVQKMPVSWEEIKREVFNRNPLIHPSWMMRRDWFERIGGYNPSFRYSQDWELLLRRVWRDRIENIPQPLVRLRIHPDSSSFKANKSQLLFGLRAQTGAMLRGDVPLWQGLWLFPKLLSFIIPSKIKFVYRHIGGGVKVSNQTTLTVGIVLPMGQNRQLLEASGQWSLWQHELNQYRKAFNSVELFEYRFSDWRRFFEAILMPLAHRKRLARCQVLKAVHLTGAIPCLIGRWLYGTQYVLSFGYRYDEFAKLEGKWGQWLLSVLLTPIAVGYAKAVIAPTEELKRYVTSAGAKVVKVIPNGVDVQIFKGSTLWQGRTLSITILFVGRLERQKNLEMLIKSVNQVLKGPILRQDRTLIGLMFVGTGSLRQSLISLAKKLDVKLTIKPPMPNHELPNIYLRADIFVLPSIVEGHPKTLLEAMSCGLPCVATDIAGPGDIITNNQDGLLVEPTVEGLASGIASLVADERFRRRLGKNARETVIEKFDKDKLMGLEVGLLIS